jgi:hypothetical protein
VQYEVQVTDEDGLHLQTPISGAIRLRADRPPYGSADVVHHVWVPTAKPIIEYRMNDDFGISQLMLKVDIERESALPASVADKTETVDSGADAKPVDPADAPPEGQTDPNKVRSYTLHALDQPFVKTAETRHGKYELNLEPLMLDRGDRLKLTLEITDYRGDAPGVTTKSEALILDISDESGVLAAISEADERSEERLTDIIKKQLGIGESP